MNSKIYTLLLIVLCVIQSLNARSTHSIAPRISNSDNDIIQTLNELLNKIHKSVDNIEQVVQSLEEKIKEDLGHINLSQIIAELEKKIEDIAEQSQTSFVIAVKCLVAEQPALRELEYITTQGVKICQSEADQTKNEITKRFVEISVKAANAISNVTGGIMNCFNHSSDKVSNCLGNLVQPSMEEVNSVLAEIESGIEDNLKLVSQANRNLSQCIEKVQHEIVNKENQILDDFQKCIRV